MQIWDPQLKWLGIPGKRELVILKFGILDKFNPILIIKREVFQKDGERVDIVIRVRSFLQVLFPSIVFLSIRALTDFFFEDIKRFAVHL